MGRRAPFRLELFEPDLIVARTVARRVTPAVERPLRVATWVADEKVLLAATMALWAVSRTARAKHRRRGANHLLACAAASAILPHLLKRLVDRERPDRVVVHGLRHGVPRSGNAWDSFPSGHALHIGALAAAASRLAQPAARPFVWFAASTFAAMRVLLLAHWTTDVVAGLGLGVGLEWFIAQLTGLNRRKPQAQSEPACTSPPEPSGLSKRTVQPPLRSDAPRPCRSNQANEKAREEHA